MAENGSKCWDNPENIIAGAARIARGLRTVLNASARTISRAQPCAAILWSAVDMGIGEVAIAYPTGGGGLSPLLHRSRSRLAICLTRCERTVYECQHALLTSASGCSAASGAGVLGEVDWRVCNK